MTDRYNALTVILESDTRDDDTKALISAIFQLKGVINVTGNVVDVGYHIAKESAKYEFLKKIQEMLVGIGGPLNGNKLGYSHEQILIFCFINKLLADLKDDET